MARIRVTLFGDEIYEKARDPADHQSDRAQEEKYGQSHSFCLWRVWRCEAYRAGVDRRREGD